MFYQCSFWNNFAVYILLIPALGLLLAFCFVLIMFRIVFQVVITNLILCLDKFSSTDLLLRWEVVVVVSMLCYIVF